MSQRSIRVVRRARHGLPSFVSYAGFVSRLLAMVVDLLIVAAVWVTLGFAVSFVGQTSGIGQIVALLRNFFGWVTPLQEFLLSAAFELLVLLSLTLFYFTFFYTFGGATLGKYLMGLRVLRSDGGHLRPHQAALRTLAYVASMLPVYLGFLNVLVDDRRRAWHDLLTGTVVVHSWYARPDETFLREAIQWLDQRPH
jgi:uncharacterized RDD family membrane protein YckC